jgi:uncharacterized membrane protein HdeD (DUF308 family)
MSRSLALFSLIGGIVVLIVGVIAFIASMQWTVVLVIAVGVLLALRGGFALAKAPKSGD